MPTPTDILGTAKLVKEAAALLTGMFATKRPVFDPKLLIAICEDLRRISRQATALRNAESLARPLVREAWAELSNAIEEVLGKLAKVNVEALSMYGRSSLQAMDRILAYDDVELYIHYSRDNVPLSVGWFKDFLRIRQLQTVASRFEAVADTRQALSSDQRDPRAMLAAFRTAIDEARAMLSNFVVQHWTPKDLQS